MRRARTDPTDENLHEWRKRVKDLWHAEQIMRRVAPKKMKKLAKLTHSLSDVLGDDHDLSELRLSVEHQRDSLDDPAAQAAQIAVIDRRRHELQRQAFALGKKVYLSRPKRFVRAVEHRWHNHASPPAATT